MKHKIFFLLFLSFFLNTAVGQEYRSIFFGSKEKALILEPGTGITIKTTDPTVAATHNMPSDKHVVHSEWMTIGAHSSKMLRIIGGTVMPGSFKSRGETNFRRWEYYIDDYLDSVAVLNDRYSLLFRGNNDRFDRKAYHRIAGDNIDGDELELSVQVKRSQFVLHPDGQFGVELEVFYKKDIRHADDIYDAPDARLWLPVEAGHDVDFIELKKIVTLSSDVAALVVVVGGNHFSGDCLLEAPVLKQKGKQLANIPFVHHAQRTSNHNYWTGINLVSRNWPVWQVKVDGNEVFNSAVFDRASDIADFYIPLPSSLKPGCEIEVLLLDEPGVASFPYELRNIELIEQPADALEIISQPNFLTVGKRFGMLVETHQPNTRITIRSTKGIKPVVRKAVLKDKGLHVLQFDAIQAGEDEQIVLRHNRKTKTVNIGQLRIKNDDGVFLSTGDEVYLDMIEPYYSHYFKWFIHNNMGNFYQFRPSYQWSGRRFSETAMVKKYIDLLVKLDMPYAWQVEGRTLAGEFLNPSVEVLKSPLFHGKQAHENDGGYYYWRHFQYEGQYSDMAARTRPYGGIFAKHRPIYTDHGTFIHYDPSIVRDMEHGASYLVENFRYSRGESTRHTGPSTLFRYLYQAGYEWLGAEQMYGPEETVMSALRGASRAYGKTDFGTLHAMQWGSRPYTDPAHAHRFYLSLATAYMHGASHINTEEALWLDEYVNDRFSESGKLHIEAQQKILDFIQTHERRGEQVNDIALIQGRNCAWKLFGRGPLWSQTADKWQFNKATESFDLIKVFYPDNIINYSGPAGWFTSMPYGAIDLLPVEANLDVLNRYKTIIFLGWNSFHSDDWERLSQFVKKGGTLLFTAAHLNVELQPHLPPQLPDLDILKTQGLLPWSKEHSPISATEHSPISANVHSPISATEHSPISANVHSPISATEHSNSLSLSGQLLEQLMKKNGDQHKEQIIVSYGDGKVIYFPEAVYPADERIRESYVDLMKKEAERVSMQQWPDGWIVPDQKTSFTVWDDEGRRTIYLLNIDWSTSKNTSVAHFKYGNYSFDIPCRSYEMEVLHLVDGLAVMPSSNTTEVLSIQKTGQGWNIQVQTAGADVLRWYNSKDGSSGEYEISEAGTFVNVLVF